MRPLPPLPLLLTDWTPDPWLSVLVPRSYMTEEGMTKNPLNHTLLNGSNIAIVRLPLSSSFTPP